MRNFQGINFIRIRIYREVFKSVPLISNFEKNCSIATKDFFSRGFHSCKLFHERVSCAKLEPKGNLIELSMFLQYGLTEVKKASTLF